MAAFVLGFIGLFVGLVCFAYPESHALGGGILGTAAGVVLGLVLRLSKRQKALAAALRKLQSELQSLHVAAPGAAAAEPKPAASAAASPAPAPITEQPLPPRPAVAAATAAMQQPPAAAAPPSSAGVPAGAAPARAAAAAPPTAAAAPRPSAPPARPPAPTPRPDPIEQFLRRCFTAAGEWLRANTVVAAGGLLLFLGLAFLLQLAAQRMVFPVELRYAAAALASIVLLVVGWRLRERKRNYGLSLQGVGVGVLYLTIFAAMRLHPLLPPSLGFWLLFALVVFSAILAVAQDSLALAAAGAAGGFAAPILTSTGGEHHVVLFSYFALLNAGILAIAWFKAWRPLNLIGFVATLVIGAAWGGSAYQPEMFSTTEPFLVLFFLMYVAIAGLFARRVLGDAKTAPAAQDRASIVKWAAEQSNYLDGILLFGSPIIGFGLQYALVKHIEYGTAFSALGLGLFYMLLATLLFGRTQWRYLALVEVYIALGAIFATLAVPLGLDASWTAAAWAVEGAGVYWIGVKQNRRLARAFALLVELGAAISYLSTLDAGVDEINLITGSRLGALMLGAALLFTYWQLYRVPAERRCAEDKPVLIALTGAGLAFLYLMAPLSFHANGTAILWAVAGLATLFLGTRLNDRSWMIAALVIQALGGALFISWLPASPASAAAPALGSGWHGLLTSGLIGGVALASFAMVARDVQAKLDPVVMRGLSALLLFGLVFVNLAVLFVLPWDAASGVWGASGTLILLVSLRLQQRLSFAFGLALQVIGGAVFLVGAYPALETLSPDGLTPLWHSGFWTPAMIGLAGYGGAWLLFRAEKGEAKTLSAPLDAAALSWALLVWATAWWGFAWLCETFRFLPEESRAHALLLVTAATVFVWMLVAVFWQWRALAAFCALSMPAAVLALLLAFQPYYNPAAHLGVLAWPALVVAHLLVLRRIPALLPEKWPSLLHVVGCWVVLGVLALELRFYFIELTGHYNAWRWLGWAIVPTIYLLMAASPHFPSVWPFSAYEREYRSVAALPVAAILLAWFWLSNVVSDGSAEPLPYFPLANPLEVGQLAALVNLALWLRSRFPTLPLAAELPASTPSWVLGGSTLFLLTCAVLRAAHHWLGIPYELHPLFASMLVQTSLSILWGVVALALMIAGHVERQRAVWHAGAALIAVVVAKLFLVELFNPDGLRIVSFIGVSVLLLIVGYFAPLPPKRAETVEKPAE